MEGRFPNLLVIGAMKAGTTSLHDYLDKHPDIFMSSPKEIHYYADKNYHKWSVDDYQGFFKTNKKIAGTSPQSYTKCHNKNYQNIPERIYRDTPDVKLIYIVRDPIERYRSDIFESYYCDPIEEINYNQKNKGFLKTSMYAMQLKTYLKYFDLGQIHILSLEDLQANPLFEMNRIFSFLSLEPLKDESHFLKVKNSSLEKDLPKVVTDTLWYRIMQKMSPKVAVKLGQHYAEIFHSDKLEKPQLSVQDLEKTKAFLEADIQEFKKLVNQEFESWSI